MALHGEGPTACHRVFGVSDPSIVRLMGGQVMRTITSTTSTAAGLLALVAVFVVTGRVSGTQDTEPVQETVIYSSLQPPNWPFPAEHTEEGHG